VSPNFYRLPELLRNSGHSKVVSKKRGKRRAGNPAQISFSFMNKRKTTERKLKIKEKHDN